MKLFSPDRYGMENQLLCGTVVADSIQERTLPSGSKKLSFTLQYAYQRVYENQERNPQRFSYTFLRARCVIFASPTYDENYPLFALARTLLANEKVIVCGALREKSFEANNEKHIISEVWVEGMLLPNRIASGLLGRTVTQNEIFGKGYAINETEETEEIDDEYMF